MFVLNKEWDKGLASLALTCVASEVPGEDEKDWWLLQRRLLQHVTWQDHSIVDDEVDLEGLDWAFHNSGNLYSDQGKLAEAEAATTLVLMFLQTRQCCLTVIGSLQGMRVSHQA